VYSKYEIPLIFSKSRKFYVPKYISYSSDFYEKYGVLGWFPNIKTNDNNTIYFKVLNPGMLNMKLFVEGVTKNGDFITENVVIPIE